MKKLILCLGVALFLTVACGPGRMVSQAGAQNVCNTEEMVIANVNKMYQTSFQVTPTMIKMDHDVSILFDKIYSGDKNVPVEKDLKEILVFTDGNGHAFLVWMGNNNCATVTSRITDKDLAAYMTKGDI